MGQQYSKLNLLQSKHKVNIRVSDEEDNYVRFIVTGNDSDVVQMLKKKLHIQKKEYSLDKRLVSFLIGQSGQRIKVIIENSQLVKIDFDSIENSKDKSDRNKKICMLYGSDDAIKNGII